MKTMKILVLAAVLTGLAGGALAAKDGNKGRRRGRKPQESLLEELVRECKLTDKQQTAVKEKIKARDAALAAWDKTNAEKVQAAETAAKDARGKQDADAKKTTGAQLRELKNARNEAGAQTTAAVMAVLTPKQKTDWDTYQLYKSTIARYRKAELTEEQLARVKLACAAAAKEIGELDDSDSKYKKVAGQINKQLRWAIDVLVLTPPQREALARKPAPKK
ncbi:MAG: hypothetical protein ISS69_00990 [Phycisphaerae bacterium]|nr:hypothetical protein [Planctomycetota bacterium]MBL7218663.1 hypothetical protein [Phycisphaerae bacterium]